MIQKVWKDLFDISEAEGFSIATKEDVEQIIDMLIADKIDPQVFISNLEALQRGGRSSFNAFWGVREKKKHKPTESVSRFTRITNRPTGTPLWFFAGYPDVMVWFNKQQEKYLETHNRDYDGWGVEMAKLLGIDVEEKNIEENQITNIEGKVRPQYYKNLAKHYKYATDKKLEVSVEDISENNIYLGAEFLNMVGAESNFTLVAENTTKYYLELTKNYKNRFKNEASLLSTAGTLDAQVYIFIEQTINPQEIIDMAQKSILSNSSTEEALINFIIKLEVKLFKIDSPDIDIDEIENVCTGQKEAIVNAIRKTKEEYTSESRVALDVANFMKSGKFKSYRKMLGIKDKFLFFN